MKRLLAIVRHPVLYCWMRMEAERMLILNGACAMLGIENPTIWELDQIHEKMNEILKILHDSPEMRKWFKGMPNVRFNIRWTLFLSRFRLLSVTREDVKRLLDLYNNALNVLSKENPTITDVVSTHIMMIRMFEELV